MNKHFLSTPLVIATMAFALVAFLFFIDTAVNPDSPYFASFRSNQRASSTATSITPPPAKSQDVVVWLLAPDVGIIDSAPLTVNVASAPCPSPPCPANDRTWTGEVRNNRIVVPATYVDAMMTFSLATYQPIELRTRGKLQADGSWALTLTPN